MDPDLEKSGLRAWKTWTPKNLDPETAGPWKTWTLTNLDPEKHEIIYD